MNIDDLNYIIKQRHIIVIQISPTNNRRVHTLPKWHRIFTKIDYIGYEGHQLKSDQVSPQMTMELNQKTTPEKIDRKSPKYLEINLHTSDNLWFQKVSQKN